MELVEIKQGGIWADSALAARKFGVKHFLVVRSIKSTEAEFFNTRFIEYATEDLASHPKYITEERMYRGRLHTSYLMNFMMFFFVMRFDTKTALKWQVRFLGAFNRMERQLNEAELNANNPEQIIQDDRRLMWN